MRKLILGIGTGRCGTKSLRNLLRKSGVLCTHEKFCNSLKWNGRSDRVLRQLDKYFEENPNTIIGDCASFWLTHIPNIQKHYDVRLVCLQRDRAVVIDSFIRKIPDERNHWQPQGKPSFWDALFPTYDSQLSKEDAIGLYWDEYYKLVNELVCPLYRMPTLSLNDLEKVFDMYRWLELDKQEWKFRNTNGNNREE